MEECYIFLPFWRELVRTILESDFLYYVKASNLRSNLTDVWDWWLQKASVTKMQNQKFAELLFLEGEVYNFEQTESMPNGLAVQLHMQVLKLWLRKKVILLN